MRDTQARLDDFMAELLAMVDMIEAARRSPHAATMAAELETVATTAEAFADAATDLEAAYYGRRHAAALARAERECAA